VDPGKVPFHRLTAGLAVLAAGAAALAGCGPRPAVPEDKVRDAVRREARKAAEKDVASIDLSALGNDFTVDDEQGRRMLEAKVERIEGSFKPGTGLKEPVKLIQVKALLYEQGRPQMDLITPEATWDGKQLVTQKAARAVTTDKETVIDARKAIWTAASGHMDLETANLQSLKNGKTDFTAEAPKAFVTGDVVTMPAGAAGRNPEGQQLRANHMRWNLKTGNLEAQGNVTITEEGTRVTGQRLSSNTKLKRGRLTGGTQMRMRKLPTAGPAQARNR
jgi:hypothetical protein